MTAAAVPLGGALHPDVRNLLYARPEFYETVYHGSDHEVPRMCERLFALHGHDQPDSLLDVGCGTGRDLEHFATTIPDCVGVDAQEQMIAFARSRRPTIEFQVADMRAFDLGRRFAIITSLGLVLTYLHTNDDVSRALRTFAAHARPGTLLVLEVINSIGDVNGHRRPTEFVIDSNGFQARASATYRADRRRQLLARHRTWRVDGGDVQEDFVEFRMFFPLELEHHLAEHGFQTVAMYDNTELRDSNLDGPSLFVVARYSG
jgi:SAM-dependent methyltransferase